MTSIKTFGNLELAVSKNHFYVVDIITHNVELVVPIKGGAREIADAGYTELAIEASLYVAKKEVK